MLQLWGTIISMGYEIYFDESNKIDRKHGNFAYYGVIGWDDVYRNGLELFMNENKIFQELHFAKFRLDKLGNYLLTIKHILNLIDANFIIVNKEEAYKICSKIDIRPEMLRKLFYMKIPERLIYGVTRRINGYKKVDIYIDKSDEYGNDDENLCNDKFFEDIIKVASSDAPDKKSSFLNKFNILLNHVQLPKTLKVELNAQSLYRGLDYSIDKVNQVNSKDSKSLQVVDVLLGMIKFLYEKEYLNIGESIGSEKMKNYLDCEKLNEEEKSILRNSYQFKHKDNTFYLKDQLVDNVLKQKLRNINKKIEASTSANIGKSEFIYNLLKDEDAMTKFNLLNVFLWSSRQPQSLSSKLNNKGESKEIIREDISKSVAQFFRYKIDFDNTNIAKIIKFYNVEFQKGNSGALSEKDYCNYLGFSQSLKLLIRRYLKDILV